MVITTGTIIYAASLLGAVLLLVGTLFKVHSWYLHQQEQDEKIEANTKELAILCESSLAILDGLEQLGCNSRVTEAKHNIEKHINEKAHN